MLSGKWEYGARLHASYPTIECYCPSLSCDVIPTAFNIYGACDYIELMPPPHSLCKYGSFRVFLLSEDLVYFVLAQCQKEPLWHLGTYLGT